MKLLRLTITLFALLLLFTRPAVAEVFYSADHFELSAPNTLTQEATDRLLRQLEASYAKASELFKQRRPLIRVKLSASKNEYLSRCRAVWPSGGSYLPREDIICLPPIDQLYQMENLSNLLAHELTHAILHDLLKHCPRWVEEYYALKAEERSFSTCPKAEKRCPKDNELTRPKDKKAEKQAYCQTYRCGEHFISSQSPQNIAKRCRTFVYETEP